MTKRTLLWLAPLLVYFVFGYWYTNTAGPLTADEIASVTKQMRESGAPLCSITLIWQIIPRTLMARSRGKMPIN